MKFSKQALTVAAILTIGSCAGAGIAFADHFNANNYPKGWTFTVNEGTKECFHGCSDQKVECDAPGKHGSQTTGGSITYHPKGKGGEENNPHVFTVQTGGKGPKLGPNGKECNQNPNNPDNKKKQDSQNNKK